MHTDSSGSIGFGMTFGRASSFGLSDPEVLKSKPLIALLELYPIVMSLNIWGEQLKNKHIILRAVRVRVKLPVHKIADVNYVERSCGTWFFSA